MSLEQMKETVDALIGAHETLYELAVQLTGAIKKGDVATVEKLTKAEAPLTERIERLEHLRTEMIGQEAGKPVTFSKWMATVVPGNRREEWQQRYLKLVSCVLALKRVNALNQALLRQSLQWVHMNLNLLMPTAQSIIYSDPHEHAAEVPFSGRIDSRA